VLKGVSPKMTINDKQWLLAQIQLLNKK
jgi:hypothetical protein